MPEGLQALPEKLFGHALDHALDALLEYLTNRIALFDSLVDLVSHGGEAESQNRWRLSETSPELFNGSQMSLEASGDKSRALEQHPHWQCQYIKEYVIKICIKRLWGDVS